jgi:AcrR family transcriptional regulator
VDRGRRDEIVRQAGALFAQRGVAATTVRHIGDAAGLRWGSLYHYFRSKDEIVDAVLRASLEDLLARYDAAARVTEPLERLEAMVRASFDVVTVHTDACLVYLNDRSFLAEQPAFGYLDKIGADVEHRWLDVLECCRSSGLLRLDVDAGSVMRFGVYSIWLSAGWVRHERRTPDALTADWIQLFLHGALAGGAR